MNDGVVYFSSPNSTVPRVVAATVKTCERRNKNHDWTARLRISGDLRMLLKSAHYLRYAEIKDGCLVLYEYVVGAKKKFDFRIPLYNLSINLHSPKICCQFSLTKYDRITPIATFQVVKTVDYDKWLKVLAVEIIRQTPLNTLKFLDVLFVNELLKREIKKLQNLKPSHNNDSEKCRPSLPNNLEQEKPKLFENSENNNKFLFSHVEPKRNDEMDSTSIKPDFSCFDPPFARFNNRQTSVTNLIKSSDSYDSGYCSLQSGSGKSDDSPESSPMIIQFDDTKPEYFDDILKRFEANDAKSKPKIKRSSSFRASVSSGCLNLINKFKKLNSKDNDNVSAKRDENLCRKRDGNQPNYVKIKPGSVASVQPKDSKPTMKLRTCECIFKKSANLNDGLQKNDQKLFNISNFVEAKRCGEGVAKSANNIRENSLQRSPVRLRTRKLSPQSEAGRFQEKLSRNQHVTDELLRARPKECIKAPVEEPLRNSACRKSSVTFQVPEELLENEETNVLIRLLTKCQIDKQYVPVREKRMLFESLSRLSFSVDNLKKYKPSEDIARSNSVGNVSTIPVPVKVMKRYFENLKNGESHPMVKYE